MSKTNRSKSASGKKDEQAMGKQFRMGFPAYNYSLMAER
jgi:hypothetical protein